MTDKRLAGKTALVTGAARGQGAAEARLFAAEGAQVVACDLLDQEGEELVRAIRRDGGAASYRHLDVTSEADWADTMAFVQATHGALHVLVNNAGIPLRGVNLFTTSRTDRDRVLAVNLTGLDIPVDAGFTELGVYREVIARVKERAARG